MERSFKNSSNKELNRYSFATKTALNAENDSNLLKNEESQNQNSLNYDSDKMNESEREEYYDLDESVRKSTKWTDGTVIKLLTFSKI